MVYLELDHKTNMSISSLLSQIFNEVVSYHVNGSIKWQNLIDF